MKAFISPKDLMKVKGFVYPTAQRRILKCKKHFKTSTVSVSQYCELFSENILDIFASLNSKNELDYLRLIRLGLKEGY